MESEKFTSSGLYWLCMEAENRSCAVDSPGSEPPSRPIGKTSDSQPNGASVTATAISVAGMNPAAANPAVGRIAGEKRRRGRPPKAEAMRAPLMKRSKKEDEDVCFICFDGGNLVLCDRGDCPKAYHPACIRRDEAFFHSKAKWNCGWHFCSECLKPAHYLCYTCTYSVCKACTKDADYLCVRGNKGFCATCMRVISMIENIDRGNKNMVQVDFDDKTTWEYLFKVYWMCLKRDLSLTIDELTRAQKPLRSSSKGTGRRKSSSVYYVGDNGTMTREQLTLRNRENSRSTGRAICDNINNNNTSVLTTLWASNELLDFVAHMRNGDTSALPQKEVQALLFEYIKRNNLRDPHQRSEIICDSKLANLFGKSRVRHFEMLSLLEFHFHTMDDPQKDEIGGVILDPFVRQVEGVSDIDNLPVVGENYGPKIHKRDTEKVDINKVNVGEDACEKSVNPVDSSGSTNNNSNNQACLKRESPLGVKSETSVVSLSTGSTPAADDRAAENLWLYRDPNGKVQGPFGIVQLHKWSEAGVFPPDMRIWGSNNVECNSVPLTDVLKGQVSLQKDHSLSPQDIKGTSDNASHHCDRRWSSTANSNELDIDAHSNDNKPEFAKGSGPIPQSSDWMTSAITTDTQIGNSSKSADVDTPKVNLSYSNQTQVHCVEWSPFAKRPHENSVHQARSEMDQVWNSVPNYEDWASQGNMITQATGRQCHENQINNSQLYLGQPSAEVPLPQTNPVNNWNSDESHHHYASMANLTESSKPKFSIDLQNFPTSPKTSNQEFEVQTVKEQLWEPPQVSVQDLCIQNVLSLTPKSSDDGDKAEFRNQKIESLANNNEKIQATENKYSFSPNCPAQDSGRSWSSASSLVLGGGNQLCNKAQKPCIEEWDSGFLSVASLKAHDVASDHVATPTSKCDELVPPSPPNPVPNASSWLAMVTEPIEFSTLAEESVSDLLAEVDAMESHSDLDSPNMVMDYGEDLFQDSKTDCFTSLRGLSSPLDRGKNDALSSSGDIHLACHSTMRDEPLRAPTIDAFDPLRSRRHSSNSTVMEVETKRCDIPINQFETRPNRPHLSPLKKTRDLADIMNASVVDTGRGTKHGNLNSSGSTRRDQGTPRVNGSKNRSTTAGFAARESHQKHGGERLTSPRDRNVPSGLTSPRDRNIPVGDSGFTKGRPPWSRQSAFGGGGSGSHSRPPSRGQRVCKFFENGYCRKGAFCDYLHP